MNSIIEFNDGSQMTLIELASAIRAEPNGLTKGAFIRRGGTRCTVGVLCGWHSTATGDKSTRRVVNIDTNIESDLVAMNDAFRGTNAQRAEFMANSLENGTVLEWFIRSYNQEST